MTYTETLTIQINQTCNKGAVYLRWLNPLTGWDGWMFSGDLDETLEETEAEHFRPAGARVDSVLKKLAEEGLTLRTSCSKDQARAISYLFTSPMVQMIAADGTATEVKVSGSVGTYITGAEKRQALTFSIVTGTRNSQTA
jgi:hypothetical protein